MYVPDASSSGLSEKYRKEGMGEEYDELVAKKDCEVCQPGECTPTEECPTSDSGCPCFRAKAFDLWLEDLNLDSVL